MAVYVDALQCWPSKNPIAFRVGARHGHLWCHCWADSEDELVLFGELIGMRRAWLQNRGGEFPHFDLVPTKRAKALREGAAETTIPEWRDLHELQTFRCHECETEMQIGRRTDPTTSTGCCPNCGEKNWNIYDCHGAKVE